MMSQLFCHQRRHDLELDQIRSLVQALSIVRCIVLSIAVRAIRICKAAPCREFTRNNWLLLCQERTRMTGQTLKVCRFRLPAR